VKGRKVYHTGPLLFMVVAAAASLLDACGALAGHTAPADTLALHRSPATAMAIAQVRRAGDVRFELCPADACPRPTPKTHAVADRALGLATPSAIPLLPDAADTGSPPTAQLSAAAATAVQPVNEAPQARALQAKTIVVSFAPGSTLLTDAARRELAAVVADARRSDAIEIRGRTDELGSAAGNEILARKRALAVRDYLRAAQLPEQTTIRLRFKGACCYVAGNDTAEGRAANRRVEIEWQRRVEIAQTTMTHEQH
jgi:outer membrane protein OmpA-like peptidoglycan-associated protein